tara:strand:+ start:1928 stop:2203 length:276 start_codon:yes stop_codon:yes gene_type:complete
MNPDTSPSPIPEKSAAQPDMFGGATNPAGRELKEPKEIVATVLIDIKTKDAVQIRVGEALVWVPRKWIRFERGTHAQRLQIETWKARELGL